MPRRGKDCTMTGAEVGPPCGWHCTDCSHFRQDCSGCRQTGGSPFWSSPSDIEVCPVYRCCAGKEGLEHCGLCPRLPCETLANWRDPSMSDEEFEKSLTKRIHALRARAGKE